MKENTTQNQKRTTINVSLSTEDKQFLKIYAAQHETTVAAVIHELIERLRKEVDA